MKFTNMLALVGVVGLVAVPMCSATGLLATTNSTNKGAPKSSGVATVIKMLGDMQNDTEHAILDAERLYNVFEEVCKNRSQQLKLALYHAITRKEDIDAIIAKLSAKYGALGETIAEISDEISAEELSLEKAREQRIKDNKIFVAREADLMATLKSLRGAVSILKEELKKDPNKEFDDVNSLLQTSNMQAVTSALKALMDSSTMEANSKPQLLALVQRSSNSAQKADEGDGEEAQDELGSLGAPAADKYKHKSQDIVKLLQELADKAEEDLTRLRKGEADQIHEYNEMRASLGAEIETEDFDKQSDIKKRDVVTEETAENKNEDDTLRQKIGRVRTELNKFMYSCMAQAREYDTQMKNRKEEVEVIKLATKRLYEGIYGETYAETHSAPSFIQVKVSSKVSSKDEEDDDEEADSRSGSGSGSASSKAVEFLKNLAQKESSTELAHLANRMKTAIQLGSAGGADPLKKVKDLIENMLTKLEKEKLDAQNLKIWCKENRERYGKNKVGEEMQVTSQQALLAKSMSSHETKSDRLKLCREEISDNEYTQDQLKTDRAQAALEYASNRKLDKTALHGVALALGVMRDYYERKADDKAHGAGRTIVSILKMLKADYEKDLVEAEAAEKEAVQAHDKTLKELVLDLAKLKSEEKNLRRDVNTLFASTIPRESRYLKEYKETFAETVRLLANVEETCTKKSSTIMEKWNRREKELDGLKEALEILMTDTAFIQVSAKQRKLQSLRGVKKHMQ